MVNGFNNRFKSLDTLRGLAILGVLVVHSNQYSAQVLEEKSFTLNKTIFLFLSLGKYGVEVFFVLSGWLLGTIYAGNTNLGRSYWYRRIARIGPLWILFFGVEYLILILGFNSGLKQARFDVGSGFASNLLVIFILTITFSLWLIPQLWNTVIPGGWSIQAEVFHYVFFPIIKRFKPKNILRLLIIINVITLFFVKYSLGNSNIEKISRSYFVLAWIRLNFFSTIGYFMLGYFLSHLNVKELNTHSAFEKLKHIGLLEIFLYAISFLLLPLNFGIQYQSLIYVGIMLFFNSILFKQVLINKFLCSLGKYSYFIYFCHFLVLDALRYFMIRTNLIILPENSQVFFFLFFFLIAITLSLFLGRISFKYIEFPIMDRAKRFK